MTLPEEGQTIVFETVPPGFLGRAGESYRVTRRGPEFLFVGSNGHAATASLHDVANAKWKEAKETA